VRTHARLRGAGMDESDSRDLDLRDETALAGVNPAPPGEIDLTDRLRFAASALAADFGDRLPADLAEALVFSSAQGLLVSASVTEFVPILAERRARQAIRAGAATAPLPARAAVPVPRPAVPTPRPRVPTPRPAVPAPKPAVPAPRPAVPSSQPSVPTPGGPTRSFTAPRPALPWSPPSFPIPNGPAPTAARPTAAPVPITPAPPAATPVEPLFALPESQLVRLRDEVERARMRLADWKAGLAPAGEPAR
jgi:hypothetical protein